MTAKRQTSRAKKSARSRPAAKSTGTAGRASGRNADAPWDIPKRGWISILKRTYAEFSEDRLLAVAGGVTFYALLALFPAIAAFVSLYGLAADRATLADHLATLADIVPQGGLDIISGQLSRLASQPNTALGIGFFTGIGIALWSANAGIKAMFDALNVAYDETEKRGFVRLNLISLTFTAGAILFLLVGLSVIAVIPLALAYLALPVLSDTLIAAARWPLLFLASLLALAVLYRFGPSRADAKWRWITPGSVLASFLWLAASFSFSWYAANFASYNETYGTLGAVIGFMTWIWLSAAVILLGAELNAESERQTAKDSTTGKARPMGKRGATVADTVA